jgi:hypothetical protein
MVLFKRCKKNIRNLMGLERELLDFSLVAWSAEKNKTVDVDEGPHNNKGIISRDQEMKSVCQQNRYVVAAV